MVHFTGEDGIDDGALSKTFLTRAVDQISTTFFPDGVPKDSMLHVQNGDFKACGQIVAYSLTHDGPPPCFLDNSAVSLLMDDKIDKEKLDIHSQFTKSEKEMLAAVTVNPEEYTDFCFEHGYTGIINKTNVEAIVKSIMASIITRRLCYLEEFKKGFIFELSSSLLLYPNLMKPLFSLSHNELNTVDGNFIISILNPKYSEEQSTRRQTEENILDFFQDFLYEIDNGNLLKSQESSITWKDLREDETEIDPDDEQITERAKLTAPGLLQWITGQEHKPINPEGFSITVYFEHECFITYPEHKVCYPVVSACNRSIKFPVLHMKTEDAFNGILLTGYCQGQSFSRR